MDEREQVNRSSVIVLLINMPASSSIRHFCLSPPGLIKKVQPDSPTSITISKSKTVLLMGHF